MVAQIQGMDTEYKPWGGLAGIMAGTREADINAANLLALQESQLGNVIKGVEAGRAADDYSNPEMERFRQSGIMGDNQVKTAAGMTAMGTQQSDMSAKIAENLAKVPKAKVEQALNETHLQTQGLMGLATMLEQNGGQPSMEFVTKAQSVAQQLGMQPQDLQQLLSNPELLKKKIAQNQQMLTMVPAVLQKMAEEEHKAQVAMPAHAMAAAANIQGHQISADATVAAARIRAENSKKDVKDAEHKFDLKLMSASPENRYSFVKSAVTTGLHPYSQEPMTEVQLRKYTEMYKDDQKVINAANAAKAGGKIDLTKQSDGKIKTHPVPQLGDETSSRQTSSGVKFKVVQ